MAKVYVSSTFQDLKECRAKVSNALRKVGHTDVAMEYYVAGDERPAERCLADVSECDLYVGLFAWRYGYVPEHDNPDGLSITEMEYRRAVALGKHCLIFLLSEDAPWPRKSMDKDATQIERLRGELSARHTVGSFTSAEDLAEAVYPAVYKWSEENGHLPRRISIPELDLTAYINALTRRYQNLDLDALTPPQRDENLRQRLREIFVEQNVRENPPPVELPKEVWEKLQRDREIHAEDLPSGVTPEDVLRARESYFEKPSRPVLDALTDPSHARSVVLGDPGSGKSTLARYVLLSLVGAEGDEKLRRAFEVHLPLLIELRSYAGLCSEVKGSSFLDFIEFMSDNEGWGLDRNALEHYLKTDGRAVVVFDGLDEIFDPEDRESVARRIAGFASDYPKARVLVTSRVIGYKRKILTDAEFSHFTLQDLDERQVEQFIDRWYALALDERPEEARARRERIMRSFKDSASIRQLAGNPMLLTIMAIIGKNQELPRERWKLYDHAAGVLIYHWDVERHLRDRSINAPFIGEEEKKELLRRLAFKMQRGEGGLAGNYIHRDDLQREFEDYLRERFAQSPADAKTIGSAMIDQFRSRNFILSLYGANLYGFVHRAFLEFFCATAFVQKFEKTKEITFEELKRDVYGAHWEDKTWHEVLRLICGMIDEKFAGEIISYLTTEVHQRWPEEAGKRPPWNISLALRCLSEVKNPTTVSDSSKLLLKSVCLAFDKYVFSMLHFIQEIGKDYFFRSEIVEPLESIGTDWPDKQPVVDWLHNLNKPSLFIGTNILGRFLAACCSGQEEIFQIFASYATHKDYTYRIMFPAIVIGWRHDPRALETLIDMAVNDPSTSCQLVAASSLAEHFGDSPQTFQILRNLVTYDETTRVSDSDSNTKREFILTTIAEQYASHPETMLLLLDLAESDPSPKIRKVARGLLDSLSERQDADSA